jgi:hypothetical protein
MELHIGRVDSEVRAVDDRSLLSPDVLDRVVAEVMRALDGRRAVEVRRTDDAALRSSVRTGTGR